MTDSNGTVAGILVDKAVAALAPVTAGPKDSRPVLNCIHIKNGRAYAADGFRAMAVDLPRDSVSDPAPLNIRARDIVDAVKALGRNPVGQGRYVHVERSGKAVELVTSATRMKVEPVDGAYPDIEALYPRSAAKAEISFNAGYMADVLDAMLKAGVELDMVTMKIVGSGDHERIVLTGEIPQQIDGMPRAEAPTRRISAVVMPMVRTKRVR